MQDRFRTTEIFHQGSAKIPKLHQRSGSSGYPIGHQWEIHTSTNWPDPPQQSQTSTRIFESNFKYYI